MNLLTQDEAALLKIGDFVKVYFFQPRKPKVAGIPSRQWEGREEWLESVWEREEVESTPVVTPSYGYTVRLKGRPSIWCTQHMEKL